MTEMDPLNECSLLSSHENAGNGPPQLEAMETAEINLLNKMFLLRSHEKSKSPRSGQKNKATFFGLPWKFVIWLCVTAFPLLQDISFVRSFFCAI